jgi:hypothetical protein
MDHLSLKLSSHAGNTPPTVDLTLMNSNATQPKELPAQGSPSLRGQTETGVSSAAQRNALNLGVSDASSSQTTKPAGPFSEFEWPSSTNTFKLRTDNAPNAQSTTSSNVLRRKFLKPAHASVPPAHQSRAPSVNLLSSASHTPLSQNLPVKFSSKSLTGPQRVPVEPAVRDSTFQLFPSSGQPQPRAKPIQTQNTINEVNGSDVHLAATTMPAPRFFTALNEYLPPVAPPTPSRYSLGRATPSNAHEDELRKKCQVLEAMLNAEVSSN